MADLAQVADADFEQEVLRAEGPVVVDSPILADMADEHLGVRFVKLNVDENPVTQARYNVLSIPTVILFDGGEARETVIGARPRSQYEAAWDGWLNPAA